MTWRGEAHEFSNAETFIEELGRSLGLHASQIMLIPGNHDIEWRDGQGDIDPNGDLNYRNFISRIYKEDPKSSFLRIHRFEMSGRSICIIGLDSCRIESKDNAGLGFVGSAQLHEALDFIHKTGARPDETRLALVHHHLLPVNYVESMPTSEKKLSLTLDAEAVIRDLMSAGVKLVFHGHQHQPYMAQIRRVIHDYVDPVTGCKSLDASITVIGGGSIGVNRSHLNLVGRNGYNIVDFSKPDRIGVTVRLQSGSGPGFVDYHSYNL